MSSVTTLSSLTLQPASSFPELYEPLFLYSGTNVFNVTATTSGSDFVVKGATSPATSTSGSATKLYTHNWSSTTKCAFEATLYNAGSSATSYAALWDVTSNAIVSGSQISLTGNTSTVVRSGQFTLTQGHQYAITLWSSSGGGAYITDASLIVFPSSPLTSPSVSAISLAGRNALKEAYIPLWVYSSGSSSMAVTTAGTDFLAKGSTSSPANATTVSQTKLFTLSSSWSSSQKFAFECSLWMGSSSGATVYAELWDMTSNTAVSPSQVSTSSGSSVVLRSGTFTLTPGHAYGVTNWTTNNSSSSYYPYMSKAHLVALA